MAAGADNSTLGEDRDWHDSAVAAVCRQARVLFELAEQDAETFARLRRAESIGRPVGSPAFMKQIEDMTGRRVEPAKRGPKAKAGAVAM